MKLNGRWFPQIVGRDSGNLYPPFPCLILDPKCGGGGWCLFCGVSF